MKNKQELPKSAHASHISILTRTFDASKGDVLEIGTGYFSTLLLDWLGSISNRVIFSYESNINWYQRAKKFESQNHKIILCKDWDSADFDKKHWGLVFIDHDPPARRKVEVLRLAKKADFIVIHDTNPIYDQSYGYSVLWPKFKYVRHFKKYSPWTTVVSNFKKLTKI